MFAFSDGLSSGELKGMSAALADEWTAKFKDAEGLPLELIASRLPEEEAFYKRMQELVWSLTEEMFSGATITVNKTKTSDLVLVTPEHEHKPSSSLVFPEPRKPIWRQRCVPGRRLQIPMLQVVRQRPRIVALICEFVTRRMRAYAGAQGRAASRLSPSAGPSLETKPLSLARPPQ